MAIVLPTQPYHHEPAPSNPLKRPSTEMLGAKAPSSPGYPFHIPLHKKRRQTLSPSTNVPAKREYKTPPKKPLAPLQPISDPESMKPPFYGLQSVAEPISRYLTRTFHCSAHIQPTKLRAYPTLPEFIAYLIRKANVSPSVHNVAVIYLNRLALRHRGKSAVHGHKLFFTAFIIAAKHVQEAQYDNSAWARLSMGIFNLQTVNQMEKEMLSALEWDLKVDARSVTDIQNALDRDYGADRPLEKYPELYPEYLDTPRSEMFKSNVSVLVPGQASITAMRIEKERTEKVKEVQEAALPECSDNNAMVVESYVIGNLLDFSMVPERCGVDNKLRNQCFAYVAHGAW